MKRWRLMLGCVAALGLAAPAVAQDDAWYAWSPKPDKLPSYGKNKPVVRLPAVLARHKGQARWSEQIIQTKRWDAKWIQAAPGDRMPTQYYGDDRAVWVVWGGQIRFIIQGQEPFIANKGYLVQVPFRTPFSMETVGDEPSLRFEVRHAGADPYYPVADGDTPPSLPGIAYEKASYGLQPDPYTEANRPYVDFFKDWRDNPANKGGTKPFVVDDHNWGNIIRGKGVPMPPESNRGHYHTNLSEFWFIPEGKVDFLLEGKPVLTAGEGDIVYAPAGRWHRASNTLGQMDTRIAMIARPKNMHNFGADAGASQ